MATEWIDISVPIYDGMVHWPGDPPIVIKHPSHLDRGDIATVSHLTLGAHTGTHVDAPSHFLRGAKGVDAIRLDATIGPARVLEIPDDVVEIGEQELRTHGIEPGERILLKTSNSVRCWNSDEFVPDFAHLTLDGASYLAQAGIRAIGTDYLSIGRGEQGPATHRRLLEKGVVIIEGLNLSDVAPGDYQLVCLPLRILDGDGAPARALLIPEGSFSESRRHRA